MMTDQLKREQKKLAFEQELNRQIYDFEQETGLEVDVLELKVKKLVDKSLPKGYRRGHEVKVGLGI